MYCTACRSRDKPVHVVGAVSLSDRVDPHHSVHYILCVSNDVDLRVDVSGLT